MQASQGRKAGDDGEVGSTEEVLRGRGGGERCAEGNVGVTQREVLASKTTWEGSQPQKAAHPILKSFPETYRPECKS